MRHIFVNRVEDEYSDYLGEKIFLKDNIGYIVKIFSLFFAVYIGKNGLNI